MYRFSPSNHEYGRFIANTQLHPLIDKGGVALYCTFTFRPTRKGLQRNIPDEAFPKQVIAPFMLTLARELQATITPFVGWWNNGTDKEHHTHWHAVIHASSSAPIKEVQRLVLRVWKDQQKGGILNRCEPYNRSLGGLPYVYGQHKRRDIPFWERPFTPPVCHKTGKPLPRRSDIEVFLQDRTVQSDRKFTPTVIRRKRSE